MTCILGSAKRVDICFEIRVCYHVCNCQLCSLLVAEGELGGVGLHVTYNCGELLPMLENDYRRLGTARSRTTVWKTATMFSHRRWLMDQPISNLLRLPRKGYTHPVCVVFGRALFEGMHCVYYGVVASLETQFCSYHPQGLTQTRHVHSYVLYNTCGPCTRILECCPLALELMCYCAASCCHDFRCMFWNYVA